MKNTPQNQLLFASDMMQESKASADLPYKAWIPKQVMVNEDKRPGFGFVCAQLLSDRVKPTYADLLGHPELPDPCILKESALVLELTVLLGKLALNRVVIDDCDEYSMLEVYEFIRNTLLEQEAHAENFSGAWNHINISDYRKPEEFVHPDTLEFLRLFFSHDWRFLNIFINSKILIDGISYVPAKSDDLRMKMVRKFNYCHVERVHLLEKHRHHDQLTEVIDIELRFPKTRLVSYLSRVEVQSTEGTLNRIIRKLNGLFVSGESHDIE